MDVFFMIATVIIALTLIGIVLLQGQGSGLGTAFGGDAGVHRTRRGVEKTMFNLTLTVASLFLLLSLVTVALH
jgi:preprotein translocase subunit SecG